MPPMSTKKKQMKTIALYDEDEDEITGYLEYPADSGKAGVDAVIAAFLKGAKNYVMVGSPTSLPPGATHLAVFK